MRTRSEPTPPVEAAELRYHRLRAASERFQCGLPDLEPSQQREVERLAQRTFDLESLVLAAPEAVDVSIPEPQLREAIETLRARYPDQEAFQADLVRNGLDEAVLRRALRRELAFDAVIQRVGARCPAVTGLDVELFYELHRDRFATPERRSARHILITINEDYAENHREVALARIERVVADLRQRPDDFAALARRHSECPTALEGGVLGTLTRGQLFPALDAALFGLESGALSGVVESPLGLHLLRCDGIEPASTLALDQVRGRIEAALQARNRRDLQQRWIAGLRQEMNGTGPQGDSESSRRRPVARA